MSMGQISREQEDELVALYQAHEAYVEAAKKYCGEFSRVAA